MTAPITTIRKAAIDALIDAGLTCAGASFSVEDSPVFGQDPIDVPALQVGLTKISADAKSLTTQYYDKDFRLSVRAICQVSATDGFEGALADAEAQAEQDICDTLLPTWRTWATGAGSVKFESAEFYAEADGDMPRASVVVNLIVTVPVRHQATAPTGAAKIHVEVNPTPKTTAGWEE